MAGTHCHEALMKVYHGVVSPYHDPRVLRSQGAPLMCVSPFQGGPGIREPAQVRPRGEDSAGASQSVLQADGPVDQHGGGLQSGPEGTVGCLGNGCPLRCPVWTSHHRQLPSFMCEHVNDGTVGKCCIFKLTRCYPLWSIIFIIQGVKLGIVLSTFNPTYAHYSHVSTCVSTD